MYWAVRATKGIDRTFGMADYGDLMSVDRFREWAFRMWYQFQLPGVVLMSVALILSLGIVLKTRNNRFVVSMVLAAALAQVGLFYLDGGSVAWTGYPRFHLLAHALIAGLVFLIPSHSWAHRRLGLAALVLVFATTSAWQLIPAFKTTLGPDFNRNFIEHYDSPRFFPLRRLLTRASDAGMIQENDVVYVAHFGLVTPLEYYYWDFRKYQFEYPADPQEQVCGCDARHSIVLRSTYYLAGLLAVDGGRGSGVLSRDEFSPGCFREIERRCDQVITVEASTGETIGILGATGRSP